MISRIRSRCGWQGFEMVINVFKCSCGHYNFDHAVTSAMERLKHRLINDWPIGDGRCLKCECKEMRINIG